jgi:hypothetical protein
VAGLGVVVVVAVAAVVAAVAVADRLGASATGTVGSTVEGQRYVNGPAAAVTVDSLEASAPASDCTAGHSLGAGIHLAAVGEGTIHIGRLYKPVAASWRYGGDPWRVYHSESSHQKSLYGRSIVGGGRVVRMGVRRNEQSRCPRVRPSRDRAIITR